ncbi:MAG: enoyl-CoA hydratase/isomerase family protein [Methylobacteriaceae bacterium]|nr:enoyl-CoA hydratase/isomerase family protein [Methylobacteriaceae bacterium]
MSATSRIRVEANGPILEITFDHPPAHAFDRQASFDLDAAFTRLETDKTLRCAIVTATGDRIFSGGWDLKSVASGGDSEDFGPRGFMGLRRFDLTKPFICAVNGLAVGGGFELALMAPLVIAAPHAEFGLPELHRGFVPEAGGLWRAQRKLPLNVAHDLFLTGRRLTAEEGLRLGFVNRIVAREALMQTARDMAQQIVAAAPLAVAAYLDLTRALETKSDEEAFRIIKEERRPLHLRARASSDYHEGARAFAEKRPPRWRGE